MFCPECGAEFREGIEQCFDCEVPLIPEPPPEPEVEAYVTVLETFDVSIIPLLKTALAGAGIPYRFRGEGLMNIFPAKTRGALFHDSAGEVLVRVPESRADEARQLLESTATLTEDDETGEEADTGQEADADAAS